jgi:tetratricopeptide (TPR) repeat protein
MSPEQARGEAVDARSDIWSIGCVLYEMLSGHRPFRGGYEAAVAYSIINEEPDPIEGIPEDLAAIVKRALSKDPATRYADAAELASDLADFSGDSATRTVTAGRPAARPADVPTLQGVVVKFAVGAAVVLAVVYGAMIGLGLPGWVFPAAVLLALAGLPIVLYGASLDRKRAKLDSGERRQLGGLKSWLTTRRAFQGGLFAGGGLVIAVIGFLGLRSAGVGPFATLISGGTLDRQDAVIVADFNNITDDESLGLTVTEAFKIDLSQSSAVRMLDRSQIISALQRMQMDAETPLTADIALRIAEREGVKAIIEGDINAAGAGYILNARILSAEDGSQLAAFRENARTDADILDAIDALSAELREGVGESLTEIRGSKPLERVTTSNTEALRLYTEAEELSTAGRTQEAIELTKRVIELDSTFAMAYRKLAVMYSNMGEPQDLVDETITRGYELRERLPLRERLLTEAYYFSEVEEDEDEEARRYEDVLRKHPYDRVSLNNLAIIRQNDGDYAEAEQLLRRALEVEEGWTFRANLVIAVANQGDSERAFEASREFEEGIPGHFRSAQFRAALEYLEDDFEAVEAWQDSLTARRRGEFDELIEYDVRDNMLLALGRLSEARDYHVRMQTIRRNREDWDRIRQETGRTRQLDSLSMELDLAWERSLLTGDDSDVQAAWNRMEPALEARGGIPDSIDGPRGWFAGVFASTGDLERARAWNEDHKAYHARTGEPLEEFGRLTSAYVDGRTGGDIDEALANMELGIEEMGCDPCFRMFMGDLEESRGNLQAAVDQIEAWTDGYWMFKMSADEGLVAAYNFRLGYLYEQLGNFDEAIRRYQYMADRWANADAVLQPQVEEAKRRIETLLDRQAREPAS